MRHKNILLAIILSLSILSCNDAKRNLRHEPQVHFALEKIESAMRQQDMDLKIKFRLNDSLDPQAFRLRTVDQIVEISGGDKTGIMYGGLEFAELIELNQPLASLDFSKEPYIDKRGLKFNIPLDARCPSYDDTGDAAQESMNDVWDIDFWTDFLDRMAMHRYNVLSLWTPNPFQVMVKLPGYPDLALDDVCRTTVIPGGEVGEWNDAGGVNDKVLDHLEVIKTISIDEKIAFWNEVFDYAKDRGIDIYLITWNIYTNGSYGKYGLTDDIDNPKTKAYYREAVNVFLKTYPQLKGIGVTAGERMHVPAGRNVAEEREKWLWESYGEGILDYKQHDPDRHITFLHRVWYTDFDLIMKYWDKYPDTFDVGYKYVKARLYSSPQESPFIGKLKQSLENTGLKCWWNLRNDDIFVYRWGDPDYVRTFISNLPRKVTAAYHMGADGYVFGRVFSDKAPAIKGSLELDKHWYKFMLWGRLGYDNSIDNTHFTKLLEKRYGTQNADLLFSTWQSASKIIPQINRYIFHSGDRHWAPEMCSSRESFKYTACFRKAHSMPASRIRNPFEAMTQKSSDTNWIYPDQVIDSLDLWANQALNTMLGDENSAPELRSIFNDIHAFAWLGRYYARKIEAACLMEEMAAEGHNSDRINRLNATMEKATNAWKQYADLSDKHYHTQMYARVNTMDWKEIQKEVERDQQIVSEMYHERSLLELKKSISAELSVAYPYKNISKRVEISAPAEGYIELALFDDRNELVDYYRHACDAGTSNLMWEDLAWAPKGTYTLVLIQNGKTACCNFEI